MHMILNNKTNLKKNNEGGDITLANLRTYSKGSSNQNSVVLEEGTE